MEYKTMVNDDRLPIELIRFSGRQDESAEKHWHNALEIIVPVSGGNFTCRVNATEYDIHPSESSPVIIINSQCMHSYSAVGEENFTVFALKINYRFMQEIFPQIENLCFVQPNEEVSSLIREEVYKMDDYYNIDSPYKNLMVYSSIANIMFILFEYLSQPKTGVFIHKSSKSKKRIREITNYIDNHYFEDLNLETLASHFQLSKQHLLKLFRENIDVTTKTYITSVRVRHAQNDLVNTTLSLAEVAVKNGFSNINSLNRAFVDKCGMTSAQYRKKMNK